LREEMEAAGVCWYLLAKRVITWTELTEKMSILDVEMMAHAYIAVNSMEARARKKGDKPPGPSGRKRK
jgi:hypothetical protein